MNILTGSITNHRYIDGWVAAANAAGQTPEQFVSEFMDVQGRSYAGIYKIGTWPAAAFVMRFSNAEITAIRTAAEADENVTGILAQLQSEPFVAVDDPRVKPGLNYLVAVGLLSAERAVEILTYERPQVEVME
jgi:hypothetical protein